MTSNEELQSNESEIHLEENKFSPEQLDQETAELEESVERETQESLDLASEIQSDPVSNYEEKQEAKSLSQQARMTRRDFLKKVTLLAGSVLVATPDVGRAERKNGSKESGISTESKELSIVEKNKKLLTDLEHAVPSDVFRCLAKVIDPNNIMKPLGGYFDKDYINTKDEEKEFNNQMKKLGYKKEEIKYYREIFSGGRIVFSESVFEKEEFENVLAHERMHKEIENLPENEKRILDEARDFIINDYKNKEAELGEILDPIFGEARKKGKKVDHRIYGKIVDEFLEDNSPILLNKDGKMGSGGALMSITRNNREFYTYLMMGDLSPRVEEFLQSDFSDAYEIYIGLKNGIYQQIEQSKKE